LLLYFVIAKFVVPPTKKFMAQREQEIAEGLRNADEVKKQLAEAEKMKEEIIAQARAEGKAMIDEMRSKSDELSKKMMEEGRVDAQVEVKRLVSQAEAQLDQKRAQMDEEVVRLAKSVAEKALRDSLTADMQHQILRQKLEEVKKVSVHG
jgi:F-type H+-transporting ATPase subunit b